MQLIADLQLHSKYSRAVSPEMVIPKMYEWNLKKGIGLLATGDWTHPLWIRELKANLEELGNGLLKIKKEAKQHIQFNTTLAHGDPLFLLSGEVSCIYTHNGKGRRNHILMFAPSFAVVDKINSELTKRGCNLSSDPAMNWRVKELDTRTLISCSDSHSGPKLMREATIYAKPGSDSFSFND